MKKFAILSSFALLGAVSLASLHIKPAIAQCGWGDITCNPKDWTCPVGGCMTPPPTIIKSQTVDTVIIQTPVNKRVLDFTSSSNDKEPLILVNKHSGESQRWELRKQGSFYIISSMVNSRVLDFRNAQNGSVHLDVLNGE
ncbi:MAG: hypothetical protein ACK58N_15310 [Synechocystis sp.]